LALFIIFYPRRRRKRNRGGKEIMTMSPYSFARNGVICRSLCHQGGKKRGKKKERRVNSDEWI